MQCAISAHSYRRGTLCIFAIVSYLKIFDGLPIPVHPLLYPDFTRRAAKIFFFLIGASRSEPHSTFCIPGIYIIYIYILSSRSEPHSTEFYAFRGIYIIYIYILSIRTTTRLLAHSGGMQEWVIQIPSIPILVSVLFPSLHLKYFRIKFLLLVCIVFMRMRTKPHPHPVIS